MKEQPEALRLADALTEAAGDYWQFHKSIGYEAAAELRRLSAVEDQRDALLEALRPFAETDLTNATVRDTFGFDVLFARAAIAKAEGA